MGEQGGGRSCGGGWGGGGRRRGGAEGGHGGGIYHESWSRCKGRVSLCYSIEASASMRLSVPLFRGLFGGLLAFIGRFMYFVDFGCPLTAAGLRPPTAGPTTFFTFSLSPPSPVDNEKQRLHSTKLLVASSSPAASSVSLFATSKFFTRLWSNWYPQKAGSRSATCFSYPSSASLRSRRFRWTNCHLCTSSSCTNLKSLSEWQQLFTIGSGSVVLSEGAGAGGAGAETTTSFSLVSGAILGLRPGIKTDMDHNKACHPITFPSLLVCSIGDWTN